MITIKKKTMLVFIFIFFLINVLLIVKRRNFNFLNLKLFLNKEVYYQFNNDLSKIKELNSYYEVNKIKNLLNNNKIKEVNFDKEVIKNLNLNIEDLIFFYYPIKIKNESNYIISNFYNNKYRNCESLETEPSIDAISSKKSFAKVLTIYLCK